ncbi:hypothetical protein [Candidatus Entotheonella palauensis]|uniref:hypothetical protein n=1 Tax=Candidatus Entotheonella palauensis TaxID=93172 RepID=UPI000B7F6C98|nr:hypothetical protein [Candidatus Entotheonella palauensis]
MKTRQIFETYNRTTSAPQDTHRFCPACGAECIGKLNGGKWRQACPACERSHTLVVALLAERIGGHARGGDDIDLVKWFRFDDDLPELAFEGDRHLIERYYQTRLEGVTVDPDYAI